MAMGVGARSRTAMAEINVTPLVDVMLVLLIIFMITAPMLQHELDVNLPVAAGTPQVTAEDQVVLTVNKQGSIYLDQTPYTLDTLRPKLQTLYQTRRNKDIFLRADTGDGRGEKGWYSQTGDDYSASSYNARSKAMTATAGHPQPVR
jgi:biopolymer transport protein TolR